MKKSCDCKKFGRKSKTDPLSVKEKNKIIKDLKARSSTSPQLTDTEKAAIINSLR